MSSFKKGIIDLFFKANHWMWFKRGHEKDSKIILYGTKQRPSTRNWFIHYRCFEWNNLTLRRLSSFFSPKFNFIFFFLLNSSRKENFLLFCLVESSLKKKKILLKGFSRLFSPLVAISIMSRDSLLIFVLCKSGRWIDVLAHIIESIKS